MTVDEMLEKLPRTRIKPGRRYRNIKCEVDGLKFDSKHEAARYRQLRLMERTGSISELRMQVAFILVRSVVINGRKKPAIRYVADFVYLDEHGQQVVEDAKSAITKTDTVYRMKLHLMKAFHDIEIREV